MTLARTLALPLVSVVSLLFAWSCGGSTSSGAPPAGSDGTELGATQVSLGSSGHPELLSFHTTITAIGLVHPQGFFGVPLNDAPLGVEWTGLSGSQMWLGTHELSSSSYTGFYVTFDTQATRGVLANGQSVDFVTDESAFFPFSTDFTVTPEALASGYIELDLLSSIELGPAPRFRAVGGASDELPSVPTETLFGVVRDVAASGTLLVQAYADADRQRPLGPLEVGLADDVLLIDDMGRVFPSRESFYGSLRPGFTLLELEGDLQPISRLRARRIEIIDQALGDGRTLPVRIEGKVTARTATGFAMAIRRVLSGAETARPVLEALDDPHRIDVGVDAETRILAGPDGSDNVQPDVGHAVVTEFREFTTEPFPADVVLVQRSTRCFRGAIGATSAQGFVLVMRSDSPDGDPRRLGVRLGAAPITLLLRNRPPLEAADLITGMLAEACGALDDTDALSARSVQVHPGFFARGDVASFDRTTASFRTSTSFVLHTFGSGVHSGPLAVELRPRARIHGAADSIEGFFDLLENVPDDVRIVVNGKGIGADVPDSVQLFELEVLRVSAGDSAE